MEQAWLCPDERSVGRRPGQPGHPAHGRGQDQDAAADPGEQDTGQGVLEDPDEVWTERILPWPRPEAHPKVNDGGPGLERLRESNEDTRNKVVRCVWNTTLYLTQYTEQTNKYSVWNAQMVMEYVAANKYL